MAITKAKKKEIMSTVQDIVKKSKSVVFVNFHGLNVSDSTKVRKQLKSAGVGYTVAKKTIAKKVLSESGVSGDIPQLEGELVLAYGEDLIAPAREIYDFQKKLDNKLSILGGIFEGRFVARDEMTSIAAIPPLKTLHAQIVNLMNSPIQGFVMALNEIALKKPQA